MGIINTWALWGIGLAALPIIIHLLTRRRALPIEFSALQFLLKSKRRSERRLKLKQILLMALRILALIILAMIVARPHMLTNETAMALEAGEKSIGIIIDTSYSMLAGKDGNAPFDRAKSMATSLVDSIGESQEASIISTSKNSLAKGPIIGLTAKTTELKRMIDALEPDLGPQDKPGAVALAANILSAAAYPSKEIYFITDMQKHGWEGLAGINTGVSKIYFVDVGKENVRNISITGAELLPLIGESRYRAKIFIANRSTEDIKGLPISIDLDGNTIARGFADLKPREKLRKEMIFKADKPGTKAGKVEIPPDELDVDNRLYFTSFGLGMVRALIIDGDPRTDILSSESYYLEKALNPRLNARSRINPTVVSTKEIQPETLSDFDVLVLANVTRLDLSSISMVRNFVEAGGGLLITLGDRVDLDTLNKDFDTLLPVKLRDRILNMAEPLRIEPPRGKDPVSEIFADPKKGDLSLAKVYSRFILEEPGNRKNARVILSFMDGTPCLVVGKVGKGRVGIFATSIDRDWADLAIRPTFLPLMHQTLLYIAAATARSSESVFEVGVQGKVECDEGVSEAIITGPDGATSLIKLAPSDEGGTGLFTPHLPGIYRIKCNSGSGDEAYAFAANVSFEEGNTERAGILELKRALGGDTHVALFTPGAKIKEGDDSAGLKRKKIELFRYLIVALIAVALFEGALARGG